MMRRPTQWSALAIVTAVAACSGRIQPAQDEVVGTTAEALSSSDVLGFENPADWAITQGKGMLSSSDVHVQGAHSLAVVDTGGYLVLTSAKISSASLGGVSSQVRFDMQLPTAQLNPYWFGAVQLYVEIPSLHLFNAYVGQVELTGLPVGTFAAVNFDMPSSMVSSLRGTYSDLVFKIALNVPFGSTGTYLFDGLGFVGVESSACSGHGSVDPGTGACVCDLGAAGTTCQSCAAGFVLGANGSRCVLAHDGCITSATVWPNACSKANSDPWIVVHHDDIQQVQPTVLALLYANPGTMAGESGLVTTVANGFAEGSRTQGFKTSSAPHQIQYQTHVVDLRDGVNGRPPPPAGYPFQNSTLFPRKGPPQPGSPGGTMDYAQLFTSSYAANYGFADPAHPGQFLDLCTLVNQGTIHEVWLVASADVPDTSGGLEVLGMSPLYTPTGNLIPGSANRCANGCAAPDVPFCGRSLRIGFVNYTRGPGCFLHSQGHDIEFGIQQSVPTLAEWFSPFARFDLDTIYGLPFSNLYALGCSTPPCLGFPSPTHAHFTFGATPIDVDPYDPVCGNVHFPPNGTNHYDYFDTDTVSSSCTGFGRHAGPGGTDAKELIGGSVAALPWSAPVNAQYPDCGGEYLVWWYQNMPGHASGQTFVDGRTMKSIWPYLFY